MGKMSELDAAVRELARCGEALIEISRTLREALGESFTEAPEESKAEEPKAPEVTYEQLRGALAEKSAAGHRTEVQALIKKYGAAKLSDIAPGDYASVLAEAEAM